MAHSSVLPGSDVYTYEFFLQEEVCRFCWNTEADQEIFMKPSCKQDNIKNELVDKIRDCLNLEINEDSYPRKSCKSCYYKILEFHNFKRFCRETDRKLKDIFANCPGKEYDTQVKEEKLDQCGELTNEVLDEFWDSWRDSDIEIQYSDSENSENEEAEVQKPNYFVKKEKCKPKSCKNQNSNLKLDIEIGNDSPEKESINDAASIIKDIRKVKYPIKKKKYELKRSATYCNICRTDLGSKENFLEHNSLNHGIEDGGSIFKCFGCEKRFRTRKARLGHERNFCEGLKDGYKCLMCNRFLPKRSMYESHMRDHRDNKTIELPEDIFQCAICCKLFRTKNCLKEHIATHESEKKRYVCETCGRVFTRRDYLHKHKLTHTGTKQHACTHCGYRTSQKSSLTIHLRKHTGERPYSCDLCPQRCISSSNLLAHRRRHLGEKVFQCAICSKKFGYKISLEEHIASVHERSRAFTCEQCGAMYTRVRGLRRHLLTKHGKQLKVVKDLKEADKTEPDTSLYVRAPTDGADQKKSDDSKEGEEFGLKEGDYVILDPNNSVMY